MKKHRRLIIAGLALIAFGTVAFLNLKSTMAPYVTFAEARTSTGAVQVGGFPNHQAASFDMQKGLFLFTMKNDDGEQMPVEYAGAKPGNFDQAERVVVIGRYEEGTFQADQILVKCPSKYEAETDMAEYGVSGKSASQDAAGH
jgi:cytochrome c-type biogenesis protein CcmE